MNTFLLKINEPARKNDNIYIVQSNDIIKVGYTSNLVTRMTQYYYHNPNTIFIGSAYREDGAEFERELHSCIQAQVLNEWYPAEMLNQLIEYITGVTPLPTKLLKKPRTKAASTQGKVSFKDLCIAYIDTQDEQIALLDTLIKPAYDVLGANKMKALEYRRKDIEKALIAADQFTSNSSRLIKLLGLINGQFYPSSSVKEKLQAACDTLGLNRTIKATDIAELYSVKQHSVRFQGVPTKGFTIIAKKF